MIGHETTFYSKKEEEIYLSINMIPLYNGKGIIGTQGTAHDVTERRHADELLQYISAKDELTGLYNLNMTEQQTKTAEREKKEMLIIYTGIDGMQLINDVHGREEGDQTLIDTANILRKTFREAGTRSPMRASTPSAKAMSVAMGTPQPAISGVPAFSAA